MDLFGIHVPGSAYTLDEIDRMQREEALADYQAGKITSTEYNQKLGAIDFARLGRQEAAAAATKAAGSSSGWSFSNPLGFLGPVTDTVKWLAIGAIAVAIVLAIREIRTVR